MKISMALWSAMAVALLSGCSAYTSSPSGFLTPAISAGTISPAGTHDLPLSSCKVVYLSDPTTAKDLLYRMVGTTFHTYGPLPQLPALDNGWGLWAAKTDKRIFAGASGSPDTINVYKPCTGGTPVTSYTTNSQGPPESIAAVDHNGPIFATEQGAYVIDCGTTSSLAACKDTNLAGTPQYVAVGDAKHVYVQGYDSAGDDEVDQCTYTSAPSLTSCSTCALILYGSPPLNGASPGGLAVDKNQHLIVNDQSKRGLYSYPAAPCNNTAISTFTYSPVSGYNFLLTAITLDTNENSIVGAGYYLNAGPGCPNSNPACMQAREVVYNSATAAIGGWGAKHTPLLLNQMSGTGIAVWPPGAY